MGYELVRDRVPEEVALIVLTHHERFDGTGYPNAMPGPSIPLEARILHVADAMDAITSVRPYQPAYPLHYAIDEMIRCAGTQFDPSVVEAVVALAEDRQWRTKRFAKLASVGELAV
jgi:HD-GYP domain-containing protein (c-di-GMP phosphodiesterase class II)